MPSRLCSRGRGGSRQGRNWSQETLSFSTHGSQALKSHSGSSTIGHSIPAHASPFALLHSSTTPKVNSYSTHLGRNGDFQKCLGLPSDYQTTETSVPKKLEFSWGSHAGRRERRKPSSSQTRRLFPRERVQTILICQNILQRMEPRK